LLVIFPQVVQEQTVGEVENWITTDRRQNNIRTEESRIVEIRTSSGACDHVLRWQVYRCLSAKIAGDQFNKAPNCPRTDD